MQVRDIIKFFSAKRIFIPVGIGLLGTILLLNSNLSKSRFVPVDSNKGTHIWVDSNNDGKQQFTEFIEDDSGNFRLYNYKNALQNINWTSYTILWLLVSLVMMAVRDLAYMYRIRVLTDFKISWRRSFDVIMLWEFASAITPSIVGGSGVAVYIVHKEGVSLGRSTAVVMVTAMLDELFYILTVPMVFLLVGMDNLFPDGIEKSMFGMPLGAVHIFAIGYFFIVALTTIISTAIFFFPQGFKSLLVKICSLGFLNKWMESAKQMGDDIIVTSRELRGKSLSFWLKSFGATFFSWTARFWVVNFIIMAFGSVSVMEHFEIYARQLVMWVIMLISPTPGGSGVAEFIFSGFLKEYIPIGLAILMAVLWRLISYYPYLFIGSIILPNWLKRIYVGRKMIRFKSKKS